MMALPDITNYYLFAKVVEAGSISSAARALSLPKATVSRRLQQLETEQGMRLFNRSQSGVRLTDVGEAFLLHCQQLVEAAESAQQVTQRLLEKPRGRVNFSAPYALSQSLLVDVLPEFMTLYPEININLVVTNRPINLIDEGIDVALRVRPNIEDSSLIARPLSESPLTLFAAPALLEQHPINEPSDLLALNHLSLHYTSGQYRYLLTHEKGEQQTIKFEPRLITDDMIVLRESAIKAQGVTALPTYLCNEAVQNQQLVQVLPEWTLPVGIMHLTYPHRRGLLPAVRVLIDYLTENLPKRAELFNY
ncbi:MAG: LysR family transcriptional regulator [Pseudomonadota bacterium]|uniref:LysR family transcriptional regulator n=2 Tax=Idiomarinaceae TaxID=267893 RepID=UPI0025C48586|nr:MULTISPECIES: LysR family transcriptional regulator [unclassified Idiomarina]MEC9318798.1 LysR family transcriptional regulator [Pseudomonadota bacterium]|tara:strand:- start:570 stop:1487 length:918 start_codon:yes stop_codon:yes gene_type:complete